MATQTVIGSTIVIEGEVKCGEDVEIEGKIKGRIQTTADLIVQTNGTIEAEVETRRLRAGLERRDALGRAVGRRKHTRHFEIRANVAERQYGAVVE